MNFLDNILKNKKKYIGKLMNYRKLGSSGILVSEIGLGTNNFGRRLDYSESEEVINHALDSEINLLDTADMYSNGLSEEYIGKAIKNKRDQVIIASKGVFYS